MNGIILFEDFRWPDFLPLVYWRSVFDLRVGRKIILDRVAQRLGRPVNGLWVRDWLAAVTAQRCGAPANGAVRPGDLLVNARFQPQGPLQLPPAPSVGMVGDEIAVVACDGTLAERLGPATMLDQERLIDALLEVERVSVAGEMLRYSWDLVREVGRFLRDDWREPDALLDGEVDASVVDDPSRVHVGQRSTVHRTAIIDSREGPVFISHDVEVGPYAVLEGPLYVGPGSRVHPHTWLHGGNAIGPVCRVAGEVYGCVIDGYTNKQHAGFLGHAYVGSWVNLGAGCTNSDLKNTYSPVRVKLPFGEVATDEMFIGAIIGDHAKIGINATIPTGAVIGFAANVATSRMLPAFVPSFAWMTEQATRDGDPARLLDVATRMMTRRGIDMTDEEVELFLDLGSRVRRLEGTAH